MDLKLVRAIKSLLGKCTITNSQDVHMRTTCIQGLVSIEFDCLNRKQPNFCLRIDQSISDSRISDSHIYIHMYLDNQDGLKPLTVASGVVSPLIRMRIHNPITRTMKEKTLLVQAINVDAKARVADFLVNCDFGNHLEHPLVKLLGSLILEQHRKNIEVFEQNPTNSTQGF